MSTAPFVAARRLSVDRELRDFVENELLPDLGIEPARYWSGLQALIEELTPANRALLAIREELQAKIDAWHRKRRGTPWDADAYRSFLEEIGYLEPRGPAFRIETENVDPEIAAIAGPQLVVPASNARFALNATNARWGSLYDALYGTDVISEAGGCERGVAYNPVRGKAVIAFAATFLDRAVPLVLGSHGSVVSYRVVSEVGRARLEVVLDDGTTTGLSDPGQFAGYESDGDRKVLLLCNHGLHIEICIDREHAVGRASAAGVSDVVLESAVTTIQDLEDSVAAVDAADKVQVYRNWLGLMRGTLTATFVKNGREHTRRLAFDRHYTSSTGGTLVLPGRSLLLVRNVGHHMTTPAVLAPDGSEVFEGILDAVITATCALYDLRGLGEIANSRTGSIYIVKPKMHGSREVAFADRLFAAVEDLLGLSRYTLKIGLMDEERRTSVNLEECIRRVKQRLVFINTGFLDRTGDEIHTSMEAGAMLRKESIKGEPWLQAYEMRNVQIGIRCGLPGRAQIGKGMWPMPDAMRQMLATKQAHPEAGANCAWVPSPTAATLHAMHYHGWTWHRSSPKCPDATKPTWTPCWRHRSRTRRCCHPNRYGRNSTTTRRASSATSCAGSTRVLAARTSPTSTASASWRTARRCAYRASSSRTGCDTACAPSNRSSTRSNAWPRSSTARTGTIPATSAWRQDSMASLSRPPAISS